MSELTRRSAIGERLAQGPFVTARVGFEPATFRTQGTELTTEPSRPIMKAFNVLSGALFEFSFKIFLSERLHAVSGARLHQDTSELERMYQLGSVEYQHDSILGLLLDSAQGSRQQGHKKKILHRVSMGRRHYCIEMFDFVIAMTNNYKYIKCKTQPFLSLLVNKFI